MICINSKFSKYIYCCKPICPQICWNTAFPLSETGNVHSIQAPIRQRPAQNEDIVINVLAYVDVNPHLSVRKILRDLAIRKTTVHIILVHNKWYPYYIIGRLIILTGWETSTTKTSGTLICGAALWGQNYW